MAKRFCNIPIFIPHEACPFQCLFCDQSHISGAYQKPSNADILITIQDYLRGLPGECYTEVAFFGGTFTAIPLKEQERYLSLIQPFIDNGDIKGIRLSTRPDAIDQERLSLLKSYHVNTIELGAQSLSDTVLIKSGRGHTVRDIENASKLIKKNGIKLGLQMMIGLPGDTLPLSEHTACRIIELGADCTRIYPTLVIKNTGLEKMFQKGAYTPLSLDEAVEWSAKLVSQFEDADVDIIRLGLPPSEGFREGDSLVQGPFHPAFRELVLTSIWNKILRDQIKKSSASKVEIYLSPKERHYAIGHKAVNKGMLQQWFKEVRFIEDETLKGRAVKIDYS